MPFCQPSRIRSSRDSGRLAGRASTRGRADPSRSIDTEWARRHVNVTGAARRGEIGACNRESRAHRDVSTLDGGLVVSALRPSVGATDCGRPRQVRCQRELRNPHTGVAPHLPQDCPPSVGPPTGQAESVGREMFHVKRLAPSQISRWVAIRAPTGLDTIESCSVSSTQVGRPKGSSTNGRANPRPLIRG